MYLSHVEPSSCSELQSSVPFFRHLVKKRKWNRPEAWSCSASWLCQSVGVGVFVPDNTMDKTECPPPVTVEGDWSPAQTKTMKNKLQLYFQSKKKSSGGDCRVEAEDGAPRAAVFFRSEEGESVSPWNHQTTSYCSGFCWKCDCNGLKFRTKWL